MITLLLLWNLTRECTKDRSKVRWWSGVLDNQTGQSHVVGTFFLCWLKWYVSLRTISADMPLITLINYVTYSICVKRYHHLYPMSRPFSPLIIISCEYLHLQCRKVQTFLVFEKVSSFCLFVSYRLSVAPSIAHWSFKVLGIY